jgi:hypothetical protein
MNYFVPFYVNDEQSDIRGVKRGWYAIDECGKLGAGPFSSPCECLGSVSQPRNASIPMWLH